MKKYDESDVEIVFVLNIFSEVIDIYLDIINLSIFLIFRVVGW